VTDTAYLLGLGDVVGELRRFSLEHLRQGDIKLASAYLEKMERIQDALMRFDYPTALVALKRKQDVARSLIEKTRGEVAVAARSQELADKLDAVRGKL
jgi:translin